MKELSIEEKAKAYDRAFEIAKAWCKLDNNDLSNDDLETLFPELKEESENEKIKKSLIHLVYLYGGEFGMIDANTSVEKAVSWIEKQDEQKSQRMISAEAKEAMYDKPTDLEVFINELSKQFPDVSFAKLSRIAVRVAKWAKPTDEEMKEALQTEYEKGRADAIAEMQKEWSDKEKQMYADIIEATKKSGVFKEAYKRELVDWLKSLKDRYTWKPSDAQIRALEYIINNAHNTSYSCKIAKELLEQLKKLKGE